MKKINIVNFGPVQSAEIDLEKDIQVYIGSQASGKSTICKVIYFCKKIRDFTLGFLMDMEQFMYNHPNEYLNNYLKFLTKQFMGCFGTTKHMQKFDINYFFGNDSIKICLNEDGYVRFIIGRVLKERLSKLFEESGNMFMDQLNQRNAQDILYFLDHVNTLTVMKQQLRSTLNEAFNDDSEILYIPAGRSLLASMSEQLNEFSITDMDLTMQDFINLIRVTKRKFGNKIPEMIQNYTKTVKGQINNAAVESAYQIIRKILKADYTNENDGERIYFDKNMWVKLMYGSSGQQEALWILMLSFALILERRKSFVIIEEPEAHLFPSAQKDIVDLIALLVNTTGSKIILTTHSPYILTSLNILLYSGKVENALKGQQNPPVIAKSFRLDYHKFSTFKVERLRTDENNSFLMESLMDNSTNLIRADYIDEVSEITNDLLEQLIDMEVENGM